MMYGFYEYLFPETKLVLAPDPAPEPAEDLSSLKATGVFEKVAGGCKYAREHPVKVLRGASIVVGVAGGGSGPVLLYLGETALATMAASLSALGFTVATQLKEK